MLSDAHLADSPAPANPFRPAGVISLAVVRDRAGSEVNGARKRDLSSAFRFLAERLSVDLAASPASAAVLRTIFASASAATLGVTPKRLDNVRSLVAKAVEQFGLRRRWMTRGVVLSPAWADLHARIERVEYRSALSRLACFCSAQGVEPHAVTPDHLRDFHQALEDESFVKHPRKVLKHTIALWNMAAKSVPDWPQVRLSSPFVVAPQAWPLDRFPPSFQDDVERWRTCMTSPDPLDLAAPVRARRPTTLAGATLGIRRFASALVRQGLLPIEEVISLAGLFEGERFQAGLRTFLKVGVSGRSVTTLVAYQIAVQLCSVAHFYLRLDEQRMAAIRTLVSRLNPKSSRAMGPRSRRRLEQFDDDKAKQLLLRFPEDHARRALTKTSPLRQARTMEQALAVSLLLFTSLRIANLRTLRLDRHFQAMKSGMTLVLSGEEVKNEMPLEMALPAETLQLFDTFVRDHRPHLPGQEGPYLFPGLTGGPKSSNAMRTAVSNPLRKHTGLDVTPHIFRHAAGRMLIDEDPSLLPAVSQRLGHRSINTTLQSYLGGQSRAAGRKLDGILRTVRDGET